MFPLPLHPAFSAARRISAHTFPCSILMGTGGTETSVREAPAALSRGRVCVFCLAYASVPLKKVTGTGMGYALPTTPSSKRKSLFSPASPSQDSSNSRRTTVSP